MVNADVWKNPGAQSRQLFYDEAPDSPTTFVTVAELSKRHPAFSPASIRFLIHKMNENGFNECVIKIGKKLVLDLAKFEKWVLSHK